MGKLGLGHDVLMGSGEWREERMEREPDGRRADRIAEKRDPRPKIRDRRGVLNFIAYSVFITFTPPIFVHNANFIFHPLRNRGPECSSSSNNRSSRGLCGGRPQAVDMIR